MVNRQQEQRNSNNSGCAGLAASAQRIQGGKLSTVLWLPFSTENRIGESQRSDSASDTAFISITERR
ncbi:hypothetical protein V9T40_001930 [Parthenolecanium corni]|uniref:Uncharacterized protein n=1 Tax=Parthenolecanium corni TaxID=536013 RepID=A0AAN9TFC9_9HEMI